MKDALPIFLCLPGALVGGLYGSMLAMWGGVGRTPSDFTMFCWFFWGGFGGASLGAVPGLILGCYLGRKWVCPFLGAAVGALFGLFLGMAGKDNAPLNAALVLLGLIIGSWPFFTVSRFGPK